MASRYVPPHLRGLSQQSTRETSDATADAAEGENWAPRRLSDLEVSEEDQRPLNTIHELNSHYGGTWVHSTLHDTSSNPGKLGYIVLFRGANPRWASDHIIFVHTRINILPGYADFKRSQNPPKCASEVQDAPISKDDQATVLEADSCNKDKIVTTKMDEPDIFNTNTSSLPSIPNLNNNDIIPVFMEVTGHRGGRNLVFQGYFRLSRIEFLKPHSPELVRMLQQKWEMIKHKNNPNFSQLPSRRRDPAAWAKSLNQEWAVVQFSPVPAEEALEAPKIERLPDDEPGSGRRTSRKEEEERTKLSLE